MRIILFLLFLGTGVCHAQLLVDEWLVAHTGAYSGSPSLSNIHPGDGKHVASVSTNVGFDSMNIVQISDDAGRTWKNVMYARHYNVDPVTHAPLAGWWREQYFQSVVRPSRDTIIVLGGRRPKDDTDPSPLIGTLVPVLWTSTDRGETWKEASLHTHHYPWFSNIIAMDHPRRGFLIGPDTTGQSSVRLYSTSNAGETWSVVPHAPVDSHVFGLSVYSDSVVYLWGESDLYVSTNGGKLFEKRSMPVAPRDLRVVRHGAVVGGTVYQGDGQQRRSVIYASTNGGVEWRTLLDTVHTGGDVVSVDVDARGNILALLKGGILHRDNVKRTWEYTSLPYGTFYYNASRIRWAEMGAIVATIVNHIIHRTGLLRAASPELTVLREVDTLYALNWTSESVDQRYHVQVAGKKSVGLLAWDWDIFNDETRVILDTMVTSSTITSVPYWSGFDMYARVRRLTATDSSDWSNQVATRVQAAPPPPELNRPEQKSPLHNSIQPASPVTLTWRGDDRTQFYDVLVTSRGTHEGAWDDSVAHNRRGVADTTVAMQLPAGKTYYWYIVARAAGFSPTGATAYWTFHVQNSTSIGESMVEHPDDQIVSIHDVLGRIVPHTSLNRLPLGIWMVQYRGESGAIQVRTVIR